MKIFFMHRAMHIFQETVRVLESGEQVYNGDEEAAVVG
jgi:hypothetical protein